jgi:hypothetical protein
MHDDAHELQITLNADARSNRSSRSSAALRSSRYGLKDRSRVQESESSRKEKKVDKRSPNRRQVGRGKDYRELNFFTSFRFNSFGL